MKLQGDKFVKTDRIKEGDIIFLDTTQQFYIILHINENYMMYYHLMAVVFESLSYLKDELYVKSNLCDIIETCLDSTPKRILFGYDIYTDKVSVPYSKLNTNKYEKRIKNCVLKCDMSNLLPPMPK